MLYVSVHLFANVNYPVYVLTSSGYQVKQHLIDVIETEKSLGSFCVFIPNVWCQMVINCRTIVSPRVSGPGHFQKARVNLATTTFMPVSTFYFIQEVSFLDS